MTNATDLSALISKGFGRAAQRTGSEYLVFRPNGAINPLSNRNRIGTILVTFPGEALTDLKVSEYREALFETKCIKVGDYLKGAEGVFFVCGLPQYAQPLCALTNRLVSLARPVRPALGAYAGGYSFGLTGMASAWPARVLALGNHSASVMPGESRLAVWSIELPALPFSPCASDVIKDDLGRSFVISSADETRAGWMLVAKQIGS